MSQSATLNYSLTSCLSPTASPFSPTASCASSVYNSRAASPTHGHVSSSSNMSEQQQQMTQLYMSYLMNKKSAQVTNSNNNCYNYGNAGSGMTLDVYSPSPCSSPPLFSPTSWAASSASTPVASPTSASSSSLLSRNKKKIAPITPVYNNEYAFAFCDSAAATTATVSVPPGFACPSPSSSRAPSASSLHALGSVSAPTSSSMLVFAPSSGLSAVSYGAYSSGESIASTCSLSGSAVSSTCNSPVPTTPPPPPLSFAETEEDSFVTSLIDFLSSGDEDISHNVKSVSNNTSPQQQQQQQQPQSPPPHKQLPALHVNTSSPLALFGNSNNSKSFGSLFSTASGASSPVNFTAATTTATTTTTTVAAPIIVSTPVPSPKAAVNYSSEVTSTPSEYFLLPGTKNVRATATTPVTVNNYAPNVNNYNQYNYNHNNNNYNNYNNYNSMNSYSNNMNNYPNNNNINYISNNSNNYYNNMNTSVAGQHILGSSLNVVAPAAAAAATIAVAPCPSPSSSSSSLASATSGAKPDSVPCRFGVECTRRDCPFFHAKKPAWFFQNPCRYGKECRRKDCRFLHDAATPPGAGLLAKVASR